MRKIILHTILAILLFYISGCAGYKPIFSSSNFEFKINNYTINGNKTLGNQLYSKLHAIF